MPHSQHAMAPSVVRTGTDALAASNKALEQHLTQTGSANLKSSPDDLTTLKKPSTWTSKHAPMVSELETNIVGA